MHHLLLASTLHVTDRYRSNQIPRSLEISKVFLSFFLLKESTSERMDAPLACAHDPEHVDGGHQHVD